MTVVASLTGLFPPIMAGGVALKFTQAALGSKKKVSYSKTGRRGRRLSDKHSPF